MLNEVRYALRLLTKQPLFFIMATLTLALGIGATTAVFSGVYALLLKSLPYRDPDKLVELTETLSKEAGSVVWSPLFSAWRDENHVLEGLTAWSSEQFSLTGIGEPELLAGAAVGADFFSILGRPVAIGRKFLPEEMQNGGSPVAILSDALWRSHFGADPRAVGRSIILDSTSYTIVGVLPPDFDFPANFKPRVLIPLTIPVNPDVRGSIAAVEVIGRIKSGVSLERIRADLQIIADRHTSEYPTSLEALMAGARVQVVTLQEHLAGKTRSSLIILLGAVGCILLIACANVANLQLARAIYRRKETAVRAALGATRGQLLRLLLIESLLLAFFGAGAGLFVAFAGTAVLRSLLLLHQLYPYKIALNLPVLGFSLLVTIGSGVLFSLAPAFLFWNVEINESLNHGDERRGGKLGNWPRKLLVVSEIALCLVMLVSAGLLGHSFLHLLEVDPGFAADHVLTAHISLPTHYGDRQAILFVSGLLERIRSLPGVESAGVSSILPLEGYSKFVPLEALPSHRSLAPLPMGEISPDYLRAMGIKLLAGRSFTPGDNQTSPPVALINAGLAHQLFGSNDSIGGHIRIGHDSTGRSLATIVGVVDDVHQTGLDTSVKPEILVPYDQTPSGSMAVAIRASSDLEGLAKAVRNQIRDLDPSVTAYDIASMQDRVADSFASRRSLLMLIGWFALLAVCLAAIGIYGVVAYSVAQRTREIAIRMALGAPKKRVLTLIMSQALCLALVGEGLGLIAAFALTRYLSTLLYVISPLDPMTFVISSSLVIAVAVLGSYLPARRAAHLDPVLALRED